MPYFSYHGGHSGQFCRHAKGKLRDVVKRAIELGFTHYGLSEHAPRYRRADLFPDESDLAPDDLLSTFDAYLKEARALREEYADRLRNRAPAAGQLVRDDDVAQRASRG